MIFLASCKLRTMQRPWWSLNLSLALHLTSSIRRRGAVRPGVYWKQCYRCVYPVRITWVTASWNFWRPAGERGDVARGSATMKRARNNRWKREYRRELYEVDLPPHCVRRRVSKTKSCHVGQHQRHRPGLAIPLVVGPLFRSTGHEGRTAGYPLFSFTYAPRRETPRPRVCEADVKAPLGVGACEYRRSCRRVRGPASAVCVVSTYTIRAAHARALSNFREGPEDSPSRSLSGQIEGKKASLGLDRS